MSALLDTVGRELAAYGYSLEARGEAVAGILAPAGKDTRVDVEVQGAQVRTRLRYRVTKRPEIQRGGKVLWSGPADRVGEFLEGFWFARRLIVPLDALLRAALACENADDGEPLNNRYTAAAFAAPTRAFLLDRLNRFSELARPWLSDAEAADPEQLAEDLWVAAQGRGEGFWDGGGWDGDYRHGDQLADIATALRIGSLYVGDDDRLYIRGAEDYRTP